MFVCLLSVLTNENGSVCFQYHSLFCFCHVIFIMACQNLCLVFVSLLSLLLFSPIVPPPPLPPPPTGCAFITFSTRAMAQNAIKTMHHSQTMEVLYPLALPFIPSPPQLKHTHVILTAPLTQSTHWLAKMADNICTVRPPMQKPGI